MPLPRAVKWLAIGLAGVLGLIVVAASIFALLGHARLTGTARMQPALTAPEIDSASVARGEHIARINGCYGCHGPNLAGAVVADMPLGRFVASNLTRGRGGVGATYRDQDWDRAIRFGVRPDHRAIIPVMPYRMFNHFSDADAAALIAYLRQLPAVDHALPPTSVSLLGYVVVGSGAMNKLFGNLGRAPRASPPQGTPAYGAYLVSTICAECHGSNLRGGKHPAPDAPPGPSLIPASYWSQQQFVTTIRSGVTPGNRKLSPWMPSKRLNYLTDAETQSLYEYLETLKPDGLPR